MGDVAGYYSDSDPGDWEYDGSERLRCIICREMFVGDPDDEPPICDNCWFDEND